MLRERWLFGKKSDSFTLQWHLTNACEFHCRHCYDRSNISSLDFSAAEKILHNFLFFCNKRGIRGQICLTGGNPFLYPNIMRLYEEISESGLPISVLGNPISEDLLKKVVVIQKPVYFQVSLEGLKDYNDHVRGLGHFDKIINFLELLGKYDVRRHVMLTLHRGNICRTSASLGHIGLKFSL